MDDLISRKKLLKDLAGMLDVCTGAGDPFLAAMIRKAMECVERQSPVPYSDIGNCSDQSTKEKRVLAAIKRLEKEYEAAKNSRIVRDPIAYALYQTWKAADEARL